MVESDECVTLKTSLVPPTDQQVVKSEINFKFGLQWCKSKYRHGVKAILFSVAQTLFKATAVELGIHNALYSVFLNDLVESLGTSTGM